MELWYKVRHHKYCRRSYSTHRTATSESSGMDNGVNKVALTDVSKLSLHTSKIFKVLCLIVLTTGWRQGRFETESNQLFYLIACLHVCQDKQVEQGNLYVVYREKDADCLRPITITERRMKERCFAESGC